MSIFKKKQAPLTEGQVVHVDPDAGYPMVVQATLESEPADMPCPSVLRDKNPILIEWQQQGQTCRGWFPGDDFQLAKPD